MLYGPLTQLRNACKFVKLSFAQRACNSKALFKRRRSRSTPINANYLINEANYKKKFQTVGPSLDFNNDNGVCFNGVRVIFLARDFLECTDIHTDSFIL